MHKIYEDQLPGGVYVLNAFNSINRNVFLHSITIICPPLERYEWNCYYVNTQLFIIGGGEIQSMEGNISDRHYITLLMLLAEINQVDNTTKTAAYADDDLTTAWTITHLRNW